MSMKNILLVLLTAGLLCRVCTGQTFGFHVVQPLPGDQSTRVYDISQDGRRSVGYSSAADFSFSLLDIGPDGVRVAVPQPPNYGAGLFISGDGTYAAGWVFDSTVQKYFPARRHDAAVGILTTSYAGQVTTINGDGQREGGWGWSDAYSL